MIQRVVPSRGFQGILNVPGDKSISHRALMISALAEGTSRIQGLSVAADPVSTRECLRTLGVQIEEQPYGVQVVGKGLWGLNVASTVLNAGNSGTTIRLLLGILSGQKFTTEISGDDSLRLRPMKRVIDPLTEMGADISATEQFTAPLRIKPVERLRAISYSTPLPSAQVKSAILFAGLYAEGVTRVIESIATRDHTERMLGLEVSEQNGNRIVEVSGGRNVEPREYIIPGDISSAAFLIAAGLLVPDSELLIQNVGLNPTRVAVLDVFRQMGGKITVQNQREVAGEPMGDIQVSTSDLSTGFELHGSRVAVTIDEIPILAVAAAFATGELVVRDAQELRTKESDRITAIVTNLRTLGLDVEEYDDGFAFEAGKDLRGATLQSYGDHRIAMAFAVAGLRASGETVIEDAGCVDISFPGFWETLKKLQ